MNISVLEVSSVNDGITFLNRHIALGAASENKGVSGVELVTDLVSLAD